MPRDLQADQAMLREVLRLAQSRDFARAGAIAREALDSGFEHPLLLNVAATCLEQEGKFVDAAQLLERAVTLTPNDVGARNALALCLQRLDRPGEALKHVELLLKQNPELGFVHANKGNALLALGYLAKARTSHLRALELQPANISSMASLASIASYRGNHDEARAWAQQVLGNVPNYPDAAIALASAELASGNLTRAETLLAQLLADGRVAAIDKARANGLLGDVFDAGGHYTEALAKYRACNESLSQIHTRFASTHLLDYSRRLVATVDSTIQSFRTPHAQAVNAGANVSEHVFLLGFPRSGTTLLEIVLDGHPRVSSLDEHELLTEGVQRFMGDPDNLADLAQASDSDLHPYRNAYWDRVRQGEVTVSGKVFIDKHPLNTLKLPLIARLFPNAKILFALRDPREVVLACFRRRFKMNPATYELLTVGGTADLYDAAMTLGQLMHPVFGSNWHTVRYESLVADFSRHMHELCDFLNLEWIEGLDDFANRARERERSTSSTAQLARGLDRSRSVHWTHYRQALEPVLPALHRWVERFGYSR